MQTHALDKELLHVKEAATVLGVHESTIRRAIHNGELEALTLGERGRYRVTRDAIERFLRPANPTEEEP